MTSRYFNKANRSNDVKDRIDLHIHTKASDGILTPYEVAVRANENGLKAIAITDHDTIMGLKALQDIDFIEIVPGIEISSSAFGEEFHILGYYIDPDNKTLERELDKYGKIREDRVKNILISLKDIGINIDYNEIKEAALQGTIGRPHVARILVEKGYAVDENEAFLEYLKPFKPGYVPKKKVTPKKAIDLIKESGGIPFWAHPDYSGVDPCEYLDCFMEWGIKGIEVAHPSQPNSKRKNYWLEKAQENGLLVSGGTDFHGYEEPPIEIGDIYVPYSYLQEIKSYKQGI